MHRLQNRRKVLQRTAAYASAVAVSGVSRSSNAQTLLNTDRPVIAFAYVGPIGQFGWTYSHDLARRNVQRIFEGKVETFYMERIPVGPQSVRAFEHFIEKTRPALVVATTYGFRDAVSVLSQKYPNVRFEHCTGSETAPNVRAYAAKTWESAYLAGALAAHMSRSSKLGVLGSFLMPEVVRNINAFTLGARHVDPRVKVRLRWAESWFDPPLETSLTAALIRDGADVIFTTTNSDGPLRAAEQAGALAFGIDSDMTSVSPGSHLASAVIDWTPYYKKAILDLLNGSWREDSVDWGLSEGIVDLAALSSKVPESVKREVSGLKARLITNQTRVWAGPIRSTGNRLVVGEGDRLSDRSLDSMDWFVDGIDGLKPSQN